LWEADLNVAERRVRIVAGASSLIVSGWLILALSKVSVAVARGLPTAAIYFVFVGCAGVITFALARRSWGLPFDRRLGGVWSWMQIWSVLGLAVSTGNRGRFAMTNLGILLAATLLGSWGERSDSAAAQHRGGADGAAPHR